ncbi:hypothetical protein PQR53_14550 [Paraburkholderia fungorum]|uniref:OTU domain-containing protein n=1 Tax=Paraburkholderia fungorum TaxID=134537 RepID=UPI0038B6D0CB
MRSYAENDSTTRTTRRQDDEIDEQRDVAESRWIDQVERIGRNGEWNFELADSMPFLVSELPCWKEGGLALHAWNGRNHASFGASGGSATEVCIEVAENHYWALIAGQRVWVRPDGNCFFNAIWKALQACGDEDALTRIFRGRVPANEQEASDYFRREIRDCALGHPEFEAILILLGDDGAPVARRTQPLRRSEVRKTPGERERESRGVRVAAIGNETSRNQKRSGGSPPSPTSIAVLQAPPGDVSRRLLPCGCAIRKAGGPAGMKARAGELSAHPNHPDSADGLSRAAA